MYKYPPTQRSATVESFSTTGNEGSITNSVSVSEVLVPNPYDWLEDRQNDETCEFVTTQNAILDSYLSADTSSPEIKTNLMTILQSLVQGEVISQVPQSAGLYYLLRVPGCGRAFPITVKVKKDDLSSFLEHSSSAETTLSAPKSPQVLHDESDDGGGNLLSSGVSKSGKYWAYSTSVHGSDWGVIKVKDTETGHVLQDKIRDTKFNNAIKPITWWGDLGFFYQYWQSCGGKQKAKPQLRYHALGTSQTEDTLMYEDDSDSGYCFWLRLSEDGGFAFLSIYGAGQTCQVLASRIRNQDDRPDLDFTIRVCDSFDYRWEYIGRISRQGQQLYAFWTDRHNGEVVGFSLDAAALPPALLVKGIDTQTLKLAQAIGDDHILAIRSVDVRDRLQLLSLADGQLTTINSPIDTVFNVGYDSASQDIFLIESSFSRPFSLWYMGRRELGSLSTHSSPTQLVKLYSESHTNTAGISNKQVFYTSADGTKIPMFLVSDDSHPITKDTPILLYVYGGFGISVIPHFRPDFLVFIKAFRGIVAFANIRGGGEYGRSWYLAACKERRQTLFDDIHGALTYLAGTLPTKRLPILMGESMGALNCMSAIIQRPNLVSAALLNSGPFDVLHRTNSGLGMRGVEDIGDEKVPGEFAAIFKWSPLENIRDGYQYPPTLFNAGDQDDLVTYTNSCKMAATLQHAQRMLVDTSAIHLRVSENLGHGGAISAVKQASISVERWLWLKITLALKIYE
ncbi:Prolyl oligopeptidase A-like protein [Cladobotryum mycophilum]|uniref:Prolyl endopeptidase n=1 Tax=Cladobotryum mycophilum TaxID=491253 RepID=A0ABR0SHV7_9HYPO